MVAEGVENDAQPIIRVQHCVTRHLRREHSIRLGIVAHHTDIEVVFVVKQRNLGPLGGLCASPWNPLNQLADLWRPTPWRLIERAINDDLRVDRSYDGRPDWLCCSGLLRSGGTPDRGKDELARPDRGMNKDGLVALGRVDVLQATVPALNSVRGKPHRLVPDYSIEGWLKDYSALDP